MIEINELKSDVDKEHTIKFFGLAILIQDFMYFNGTKLVYKTDKLNCPTKKITEINQSYKYEMYKPFYHCWLLIDLGNVLDSPVILWSNKYKTTDYIKNAMELCQNSGLALMNVKLNNYINKKKISRIEQAITKLKMNFGSDIIPIKQIDSNLAIKKKLPGVYKNTYHENIMRYL